MDQEKSAARQEESADESTGDRRAGSVGERPDLAGSRDSAERSGKPKDRTIEDEVAGNSANDPGLGGV